VSGGRRAALIAAAAIAVAALAWRVGRRPSVPSPIQQYSYVDARQCQACHAVIHRDYQHVGMARSFAPAPNASLIEDYERNNRLFHAGSGRHYQMLRRGGCVFQRRYEVDSHGAEVNVFEQEAMYADGATEIDGPLPVNTDGGLIANGEPIGASGLRQVHEIVLQLRGQAGDRQVPGNPKVGYTQLYGAPGTAGVSILSR